MADREDGQLCADDDPAVEEPSAAVSPAAVPHVTVPPAEDDNPEDAPARGGCRTERPGWAGGHLHGAVRPRRRAVNRGRPPGRWC